MYRTCPCMTLTSDWTSKSWGGEMELLMTRAWREPCQPSSGSSGLRRGSCTLQQRAGETRDVGEQCLSSSLHNQFITF